MIPYLRCHAARTKVLRFLGQALLVEGLVLEESVRTGECSTQPCGPDRGHVRPDTRDDSTGSTESSTKLISIPKDSPIITDECSCTHGSWV